MGARSPPEGYRVAATRYGFPVRKRARRAATGLVVAPAIVAPLLLAGCSGVTGSKSAGSDHSAACALVAKLDAIATGVAGADVHDPDTFKKTLDTAVQDYVTNVKSLRAVAPAELHASLDRVESDVQQYRFTAAVTDRADLDAYAARTCGRVLAGATSTSGPGSTTSDSLPATSTSVASTPESSGLSSGG
jgi:outer membrane murein-binding lipoprotein Lpp